MQKLPKRCCHQRASMADFQFTITRVWCNEGKNLQFHSFHRFYTPEPFVSSTCGLSYMLYYVNCYSPHERYSGRAATKYPVSSHVAFPQKNTQVLASKFTFPALLRGREGSGDNQNFAVGPDGVSRLVFGKSIPVCAPPPRKPYTHTHRERDTHTEKTQQNEEQRKKEICLFLF